MRMTVTPVVASPARIAAGIGVAPRCLRQERGVQVERSVARLEQRRRDDLAVIGEDQEVGLERQHRADARRIAEPVWRDDRRDRQLLSDDLDRRDLEGLPPPGGARRRGDDPDEIDVRVPGEPAQARQPEPAAAEEDSPGARAAGRPVGHARALVASRTSSSSWSSAPTTISSSIESR